MRRCLSQLVAATAARFQAATAARFSAATAAHFSAATAARIPAGFDARIPAAIGALLIALPAAAEPPRSAIPWLSDSLNTVPVLPELPPGPGPAPPAPTGEISVTSLAAPTRDGTGLLTTRQSGLPPDLWGRSSALRVARLLRDQRIGGVPATRALFETLLLAELRPPLGATASNTVLLARVDRLMETGHLDQAEALISAAGITDAELFRRAFDIGLLTDRSEPVCATLEGSPRFTPSLPAHIFCLARAGNWNAAARTLNQGLEAGEISPAQDALLARFLDPQLFEDVPAPPISKPLTTLDFVLRDAVALPRPEGPLPLAFYHHDLPSHQPFRARIEAGERLVVAGAIAPAQLFAIYRAGKPAASGGVWDRAAAAQALDAALKGEDVPRIEAALKSASRLFADHNLLAPFADTYAEELKLLPPDVLSPDARATIARLFLLSGDYTFPAAWIEATNDPVERFLRALARPGLDFPQSGALAPLKGAAARGLTRPDPPDPQSGLVHARMEEGFVGEGLLAALTLLAQGTETDPGDFEAGLFLLRSAGLPDWARRIAVETLLLLPEA